LAPKVAYAAIDTLAALTDEAAQLELAIVYDAAALAVIIRRTGNALGKNEPDIARRLAEQRRRRRPSVNRPKKN
jgi:hypothetical protein